MPGLESISDFVMVYIINPPRYSDKFYIKSRHYELYNFGYYLKESHSVVKLPLKVSKYFSFGSLTARQGYIR